MVKLFSRDHTFHHPFTRVTSAFWRKYPNANAPHLKSIDCYDRALVYLPRHNSLSNESIISDASKLNAGSLLSHTEDSDLCLVSHRIVSADIPLPPVLQKMNLPSSTYAIETCVINPKTQEMVVKSRNLTGNSIMTIEETCIYKKDPLNPNLTQYTQEVACCAFMPFIGTKIEKLYVENLKDKSAVGVETIESLCRRIKQFGVMSLLEELRPAAAVAGTQMT